MSIQSVDVGRLCRGYTTITSLSSAVGCPNPLGSVVAFQPEGQNIRWRPDGIAPTSSVGFLLEDGDTAVFVGDLSKVQFIETGASATLNVAVFE